MCALPAGGSVKHLLHLLRQYLSIWAHWWSAHRKAILAGLVVAPVILVALSILFLVVLMLRPASRTAVWYQQEGARSLAKADYAKARLCYASLLKDRPDSQENQYGLAMSLMGLGEQAGASALMQRLTPEDGSGYGPAYVQMAQSALQGDAPTPEALKRAEQQLLWALKTMPKDEKAHALLAFVYSRTNRWNLVKDHLALAGTVPGELALGAAQEFAGRGDWLEADKWARVAAAQYSIKVKADPTDEKSRLNHAQAVLLQRDFAKTLEILDAGWQQSKQPVFRKAVAHVTSLWLREAPTMEAPRRLALLENGLSWDSQNAALLQIVLEPATISAASRVSPTTNKVAGAAIRALAQTVANCRNNQPDKARPELELALSLGGPAMPSIAGNLACLWAYSKAADAPSALVLSSLLLDLRPTEAVAQRAQGMVLAQQQKYEQALGYLQKALLAMPQDVGIHTALASTYEKLGQLELAEKHRRIAQAATMPSTAPTTAPGQAPTTEPAISAPATVPAAAVQPGT